MIKQQKKVYDTVMRGRAYTGLGLRVLVAGYMAYLAWKLMSSMLGGSGSIPEWGVYAICIVLPPPPSALCLRVESLQKSAEDAEITAIPETVSQVNGKTDIPVENKDDH